MNGYTWAMRSAAAILFAVSLLFVIMSLVAAYYAGQTELALMGPVDPSAPWQFYRIFNALYLTLCNAVLPFLGAAALWRADIWLAKTGTEALK